MPNIRKEARSDDETKKFLVALMNRYDLKPSEAGSILHDVDELITNKGLHKHFQSVMYNYNTV